MYIFRIFLLHSLPFTEQSLVGLTLDLLTTNIPSLLWHCWLGHVTHKIVPEMI